MNIKLYLARRYFADVRVGVYLYLADSIADNADLRSLIEKMRHRALASKSRLALIYSLWLDRFRTGSLYEALRGTVPVGDEMILKASEEAGDMAEGLRFLAASIDKAKKMRGALRKAVVMPVAMITAFFVMMYFFATWMVPILSEIIAPESWPFIGRVMYAVSSVVRVFGLYIYGGLVAVFVWYMWSLPRWRSSLRLRLDRSFLPYSIYRDFNGALILVSLSALQRTNTDISLALRLLRDSATPWMARHLSIALDLLRRSPDKPGSALNTGMLSPDLANLVADYEERSDFATAVGKIGARAVETVTESVEAKAKTVNVFLTILIGATLAFMIVAILLTAQEARTALREATMVR